MQKKKNQLIPENSSWSYFKEPVINDYKNFYNHFLRQRSLTLNIFLLLSFLLLPLRNSFAGTEPRINKSIIKGLQYCYNFNWLKADKIFQNLIDEFPDKPQGYHYKAGIFLWHYLSSQNEKDFKQFVAYSDTALEKARKILSRTPDNTAILYIIGSDYSYRAIAFSKAEKFLDAVWASKKSESYLSRTLKLDSTFYDAYLGLGLYNFAVGQIPGAFRWALNLAGIHGNKKLGLSYIKKAAAEGIISKVEAEYYLSQILTDYLFEYNASEKYLRNLVIKYPDNLLFNYSFAVLSIKKRKLNTAKEYLERILHSKDTSFKQIKSFSTFLMGDVFFRKNLFDSAEVYYRKFLHTALNNNYMGIASYRLAVCYELGGDTTLAREYFEKAGKGNMDIEDDIYAKRKSKIYEKRRMTSAELKLIKYTNMVDSGKYKSAADSLSFLLEKTKGDELDAEIYLELSDASFHLGNYKEALNFAVTAKVLNTINEKWIKPFACYYAARADKSLGDKKAVENFVDEAEKYSDYDYQKKLHNLLFSLSSNK